MSEGTKLFQTAIGLPGRAARVLTAMERGEFSVQTPMLDLRVRRLERAVGRITTGLVFAALLIAGAILYGTEPVLAKWLMGASVLPLIGTMMGGRGRHWER